jgi:hypothetical protein
MMTVKNWLRSTCFWIILPSAASAQMTVDFGSVGTAVAGITVPMVLNPCPNGQCTGTATSSSPKAAAAARPAGTTRFHRDPALFAAKEAMIVRTVGQKSPQLAAEYQKLFQQDVLGLIKPQYAKVGYDIEDAADLTAAYWITAWEASNNIVGRQTDPQVAHGVRDQLRRAMLSNPGFAKLGPHELQDVGDTMLLQALLAELRMRSAAQAGPQVQKQMSDMIHAEASGMLKVDLRAVRMTAAGMAPASGGPAMAAGASPATTASPSPAAASQAPAGTAGKLAGLYFRAIAATGSGVDFEPIAMFANGDYLELGETPLAELDAARSKAREPRRWGRWRKSGATFLLTGSDGRTEDYQLGSGNFFPAFASGEGGTTLTGTYSRTTSTGVQPAGGMATVMSVNKISFSPDGRFAEGSNMGAMGNGVFAGRRIGGGGRYRLSGTTLELSYADGRVKRTSFLYGATGRPAHPSKDMVFIGGDTFVTD